MTKLSGVLITSLLLVCALNGQTPSPAVKPTAKPTKKPQATHPTPKVSQTSGRTINGDGWVETAMPDGTKRLTRPGGCGFFTVFPDGKKSGSSCVQVPIATPPLPDQVGARWLEKHNAYLLQIVRSLLGNDEASVNNYLHNDEPATATIYDKIALRTDLIDQLTKPQ